MWLGALLALGWSAPPPLLSHAPTTGRCSALAMRSPPVAEKKSFFSKVKEINEANKFKTVKKGDKPRVGPKRMPPKVVELTKKFRKQYEQRQLDQLWGAMLACYGTEALATQAAFENPQIINPSYSFCNTMLASRDVLFDIFDKEEALEVMLKNPGVLQCGPSLDTLGPDEIKGFANIRNIGNKIPEGARNIVLSFSIALALFPVFAQRVPGLEDSPLLNVVKPLVGIFFAVAVEGSRIAIIGTLLKAKASGDERLKKAEANEKRRMGIKK